jgi:hypothetical protein
MAVATSLGISEAAAETAASVLARAALVHRFDPLELIPADAGPIVEARALALVARDATETALPETNADGQVVTLWRLTPDARRRELRKLRDTGKLEAALKQAEAAAGDTFARHLQTALQGRMNPGSVRPDERESAAAAARFAAEVMDATRAGTMKDAVLELRTTLAEAAEEQRTSSSLPGKLVGRARELATLEAFAATGAIAQSDRLPVAGTRAIEVAAYLLAGPSGAGKSALVADVVRRWRDYRTYVVWPSSWTSWDEVRGFMATILESAGGRAMRASRRLMELSLGRAGTGRIVVLDLDRIALAIGGEIEWTEEVTRQIGLGTPALVERLRALRKRVRASRRLLDPNGTCVTARIAATADLKQGLAQLVEAEADAPLPLVVVLDDFEEVVARSFPVGADRLAETLFGRVLHFADSFASLTRTSGTPLFSAVRIIAAGNEVPPRDNASLARWFEARMELRPWDATAIPAALPTEGIAEPAAPDAARARDRSQQVGPLRMHSAEVAMLPAEEREAAVLSRMEFARREGRALLDSNETADLFASDPATAPAFGNSPDRLFDFLRERAISTRIDYAFTFGDFAGAAGIGWRRIATIPDLPDLSEPWRLPGDPVLHWIWQAALAALAIEDATAARPALENFLVKFARCIDPAHALADATGLVLAAAATIALDARLSPELPATTKVLADQAAALARVRSFADLRILALHPSWRDPHALPPKPPQIPRKLRIPYRHLRIFSESLLAEPLASMRIDGQARLLAFVADARIEAPSSTAIDAVAIAEGNHIELDIESFSERDDRSGRTRIADMLVGLSPELYDVVLVASSEADKATSAAIDHAIGELRSRAPFWPRDLVPERTPARDRDRRAGLIARTIIHADRCGLLGALLETATEQVGTQRLRDVTRLVQRYEALRRRAFIGD